MILLLTRHLEVDPETLKYTLADVMTEALIDSRLI